MLKIKRNSNRFLCRDPGWAETPEPVKRDLARFVLQDTSTPRPGRGQVLLQFSRTVQVEVVIWVEMPEEY